MSRAREFADLAGSADAGGITGRNLIINGAMQVAQRGTVTGHTSGYGGPDRFQFDRSGAAAVTLSQDTDVPSNQGFSNSFKVDVTTADSSLAAGDYALFQHRVEAQNLQHLLYGTSDAKKVTLQFWVKSAKTGVHIVELMAHDAQYFNPQSYTIASANTWQKVTMTFDGYQSGAINNDNGIGFAINWWLAAGSTYSGGTLSSNTWHNTAANRAVGQVNVMDSTSNNFYLTGIQLEVGDTATDFEHRSFADELARCQRYYNRMNADNAYSMWGAGFTYTTSQAKINIPFPVEMRTAPSLGQSANSTLKIFAVSTYTFSSDATINNPSSWGTNLTCFSSGLTAGQGAVIMANNDASAYLEFIAEL
tara:strand:+ start:2479 stop:3567 length:1089 start_codon:yes stop_codon:yes gene_type:complete